MSNDNAEIPNALFRQSVTGIAFALTLGHTHICVLDEIAHSDRDRSRAKMRRNNFVGPAIGLGRRGLVEHRHAPNWIGKEHGGVDEPITNYYRLTRAGWLMHDLLAEAGMVSSVTERKLRKLVA